MEAKITVLHVVGGMQQGGVENFLMNLYRNINREKVQFDFLVNREGTFDEEIKQLGGKIYYIPALQKVGQIKYTKNLDKFFKEHKEYKIVHSHMDQVSGLILERANKAGIPVRIAHSHNSASSKNIIKAAYKGYLGTKICKNATLLIGCSDKAVKWLYKKQSSKAIIINNGIEIEKFKFDEEKRNKIRNELKIKENEIVIGHVGRFSKQKNHKYLIKIFQKYNKLNENSKLLLIGKGELKDKIIAYIKENGLNDKVIIFEDRKDVNELMQAMDLLVFPSLYEGLPLTLIEAQIAGLNVICSSTITKTVNVTGNVKFLDIHKNPNIWVDEILKTNINKDRYNDFEKVKQNGYDIRDVVVKYMEIIENEIKNLKKGAISNRSPGHRRT